MPEKKSRATALSSAAAVFFMYNNVGLHTTTMGENHDF
jgi:hypothetical protein